MHWPAELTEPCSWYCQRETTGGCQQEPADVLHGTGAGRAATVGAAAGDISWRAGAAQAGAAATADRTITAPASEPNARAPRIATSFDGVPLSRAVRWPTLGPGSRPGIALSTRSERIITTKAE